jgi:dihydropyrimidine dehydrogenase (NAD+) subunit PreA
MRCILGINVDTGDPILPTYGGYSGSPIRPLGLATVAGIAQSTELPIFGIGGVENYKNVLEYIMLGASAAEVGTAILVNGYGIIPEMLSDLDRWMKKHHYSSLEEVRGTSLDKLYSFEELKVEPQRAYLTSACTREDCGKCVVCCLDDAISIREGRLVIDEDKCTGCGLCRDICPDKKITLKWKKL